MNVEKKEEKLEYLSKITDKFVSNNSTNIKKFLTKYPEKYSKYSKFQK